jgi:hypothetical protein
VSYTLRWPLQFVLDSRRRPVGWAVVHAPVVSPARQEQLADLRRGGFRLLGMCSDGAFPRLDHPSFLDYGSLCEAWCHCFREPDRYLPAGLARTLLSASDFTDPQRVDPDSVASAGDVASFDFVCVAAGPTWKREAKNWELARRCIPRLFQDLGLRALVVDAPERDLASLPQAVGYPFLPWPEFLARLARARFLFVPGGVDASPRVIAEALCLDVPVVVQRDILGGWKYVNAFTGAFFGDEADVCAVVRGCLARPPKPRRWFRANYGPYLAGQRLLRLLKSMDISLTERSHLTLGDDVKLLPPVAP